MPLKLELKPGEKFVVNGAVISVGRDGRSLILHNDATLLRDRDVMQPDEANTPARRIYYQVMLMYIDPENRADHKKLYQRYLKDLFDATRLKEVKQALQYIDVDVLDGNFYRALKTTRSVMAVEAELLAMARPRQGEDVEALAPGDGSGTASGTPDTSDGQAGADPAGRTQAPDAASPAGQGSGAKRSRTARARTSRPPRVAEDGGDASGTGSDPAEKKPATRRSAGSSRRKPTESG